VSFAFLRTEESRYLLPRAALPAYSICVYYMFFHPFGFTWLACSTLCTFQNFLLLALWNHFEVPAKEPLVCPDALLLEVRMRPKLPRPQGEPSGGPAWGLSDTAQRLLLEQGLLLLGDDRSYEAGVVVSAVIARALQMAKARWPPPPGPHHAATEAARPRSDGGEAMEDLWTALAQIRSNFGFEQGANPQWRFVPPGPLPEGGQATEDMEVRHELFSVLLQRPDPGARLGINVDLGRGDAILITEVTDGLIAAWNRDHPEREVHPGDLIVAANGRRGHVDGLLEVINHAATLRLLLQRSTAQEWMSEEGSGSESPGEPYSGEEMDEVQHFVVDEEVSAR